jgi:hypothetical protein
MRRRSLIVGLGSIATGVAVWRSGEGIDNEIASPVSLRSVARLPAGGRDMAWSRDGRRLAVGGEKTTVVDTANWQVVATLGVSGIWRRQTLAFLSDATVVAAVPGQEGTWAWETYEAESGKRLRQVPRPPGRELGEIEMIAVTGNRKYVALVKGVHAGVTVGKPYSPRALLLFEAETGAFVGRPAVPLRSPGLQATGPDNKLAIADWPAMLDSRAAIYLFDAATNTVDRRLAGHIGGVGAVAWSPDGRMIASGAEPQGISEGDRDPLRIWKVTSGELVTSFSNRIGGVQSVSWHPGGEVIVTLGGRGDGKAGVALRLWSITAGKLLFEHFPGYDAVGGAVSFHPASGQLAWSRREVVEIFDVRGIA